MRRAFGAAMATDMAGLPNVFAQTVDSFDRAYGMQASQVLEGYFVEAGGRLEMHASVMDVSSGKTVASFEVSGPLARGAVPLANELAKKLNPGAREFPTRDESAFRAYGEALAATDRPSAVRALEAATKADPRFSLAYFERAEVLASVGDRDAALAAIEAGKRENPDSIDAAKLDYLAALTRSDTSAQEKALEALARLTPADAEVFGRLAALKLAERKFAEAVGNYETVSRLDPENPQVWNELGYARAYAGDLAGARSALEHYQQLLPRENANALDSLGEVSFYLGDFAAAEKYFLEADQKNRGEFGGADLLKAAQARLLAGDLPGADPLFKKYAGLAEGGQRGRAAYQQAQWEFLTGRRKAAMSGLERVIPALQGDARSLAMSQLSIWESQTGDSKKGEELASQAAESATSPAARNLSAFSRAIASPAAGPSGSRLADAYALLFAQKFAEATPLLEALYRETNPHADTDVRPLLAWVYVKTGREADAQRLLGTYPIPLSSGEPVFASLIFPRYLFVRGAVLQKQGKRAEAKAAYQLFLKYAGDVPDIFGDEAAARKNLSSL